jgi:hypothetical protein
MGVTMNANAQMLPDLDEIPQPQCPTCDQPIAREQLERVRDRIEEQERHQAEELERLRLAERAAASKELTTRLAEAEQAATTRIKEIETAKAQEILTAQREATEQANAAVAATLADDAEKLRIAQAQVDSLLESHEKELADAREEATTTTRLALATQVEDAEAKRQLAEQRTADLEAQHETAINVRLAEQKEILEAEIVRAVNSARAAAFDDKQKLEEKVAVLQRELQNQSANELGEGAELDLYEALRQSFPTDTITRIKKGASGADILHQILEKGVQCGSILYDSKNRNQWRNSFSEKLRSDQLAADADHAVLTTHRFPAGESQVCVRDGVILANPARVVVIATLLRKHSVQVHSLRVSTEARDEKMVVLYDFISSEQFRHRLEQLNELTDDLLDLDVKELKAHRITWDRRGEIVKSIQRAHGDVSHEIDRIVGGVLGDSETSE